MNIKIKADYEKALSLFEKLDKSMKPEVIDKGLDTTLAKDLATLKVKLISDLNKDIKSQVTVPSQSLDETTINIAKSDEELIKHLTGVDLTKLNKTKEFNTLADGKVAVVANKTTNKGLLDPSGNPTSPMSSGVNLRLPMSPGDTFQNQYSQALNYYNNAMFVFIDNNGKANYYLNPGRDISRYVKVVCSKEAGDTEKANKRWDKHQDKRGYADWTLLAEGVSEIKKDFINVTDVIDKIKEGDYSEAKAVLNHVSQRTNVNTNMFEKIDNLKERKDLSPSVESYNNVVRLIKNLKVEKSIKKDRTYYTLVSTYDENTEDYQKFQEKLQLEVKMWKINNEQKWIKSILGAIIGLVNKSLR